MLNSPNPVPTGHIVLQSRRPQKADMNITIRSAASPPTAVPNDTYTAPRVHAGIATPVIIRLKLKKGSRRKVSVSDSPVIAIIMIIRNSHLTDHIGSAYL